MNKTMISARIPVNLDHKLDALSKKLSRSKAFVLTEALENHIAKEEWIEARIEEAHRAHLASDVAYSNDSVMKWLSTWGSGERAPMPLPDISLRKQS
jgi:predicted transcriptional regulator